MKERVYLVDKDIEEITKNLIRNEIFYIAGHQSISVPKFNKKFIDKDVCKDWSDLEGNVYLMTPQEAARMELNRHCRDWLPKRGFTRKQDMALLDLTAPMYYPGGRTKGELVYIDLRSAYWQIYRYLWLDTLWPRGIGNIALAPVASALERWKPARNSVMGVIRSKEIQTVQGSIIKWQPYHNPFLNPQLWHQVLSILHEVASYAKFNGACYINTDGYIFREWSNWARFVDMLESYKLEYRIHQSDGEILGWNSYRIDGLKTTEPYKVRQQGGRIEVLRLAGKRNLNWFRKYAKGIYNGKYNI